VTKPSTNKLRVFFLGSKEKKGFLRRAAVYGILTAIGFVYVQPVLYMLLTSVMSPADQTDVRVLWVPTQFYAENYALAAAVIDFWQSFYVSVIMSVIPALLQTACTALAGYAFARFEFPFKKLWLVVIVVVFLMPNQVMTIPQTVLFSNFLGLDVSLFRTPWIVYLPAIMGQGIKNSIFILIFYQFFHSYPKSFDEAAELDGCKRFKVFYKIAVPMAGPAIVISVIFSVVWYWNETVQSSLFFGQMTAMRGTSSFNLFFVNVNSMNTLPMQLSALADLYGSYMQIPNARIAMITDGVTMASTTLAILPIMVLYLFMQKQFVESVERSGITGE